MAIDRHLRQLQTQHPAPPPSVDFGLLWGKRVYTDRKAGSCARREKRTVEFSFFLFLWGLCLCQWVCRFVGRWVLEAEKVHDRMRSVAWRSLSRTFFRVHPLSLGSPCRWLSSSSRGTVHSTVLSSLFCSFLDCMALVFVIRDRFKPDETLDSCFG